MRAARFHAPGDLRLDEVPESRPAPGEVLLAPLAVGLCGTDLHILDGRYPAAAPVTLGHEVAARVIEIGGVVAGPDQRGLAVGDLVTVQPNRYCGGCVYCQRGAPQMCLANAAYGVHLDGGMAELMRVPARLAVPLPPGVPPAIAALAEPLACCLHGIDRLGIRAGLPVLVSGCGPAGAMLIALARLSGARPVVATDLRPARRDLAARVGADVVLDPADEDFTAHAMRLTGGLGFPYCVDAVGSAAVLETCLALAARGGTVLVFGVAAAEAVASIRPYEIYARELTVLGSALNPDTQPRAVALLDRLPLAELRIARYPLSRVLDAFAAARAGTADKVQLDLGDDVSGPATGG